MYMHNLLRTATCKHIQVISTALGYVLPNLISPTATHHLATVLYTIFGVRLLWIGWKADAHDNKVGGFVWREGWVERDARNARDGGCINWVKHT